MKLYSCNLVSCIITSMRSMELRFYLDVAEFPELLELFDL